MLLHLKLQKRGLGLMRFRCFEEQNCSDPSVFPSPTLCLPLPLHQPAFPLLSTDVFLELRGRSREPEKTVLSRWWWLLRVSPSGKASAGGMEGHASTSFKGALCSHMWFCLPRGIPLSTSATSGGWKLWMFIECLLCTWQCRIALITYKYLSKQMGLCMPIIICSCPGNWYSLDPSALGSTHPTTLLGRVLWWAPKDYCSFCLYPLLGGGGDLDTLSLQDIIDCYSPNRSIPLLPALIYLRTDCKGMWNVSVLSQALKR